MATQTPANEGRSKPRRRRWVVVAAVVGVVMVAGLGLMLQRKAAFDRLANELRIEHDVDVMVESRGPTWLVELLGPIWPMRSEIVVTIPTDFIRYELPYGSMTNGNGVAMPMQRFEPIEEISPAVQAMLDRLPFDQYVVTWKMRVRPVPEDVLPLDKALEGDSHQLRAEALAPAAGHL